MNGRAWTDEEEAFLRKHRNRKAAWVAKQLGRTPQAVWVRRMRLGISDGSRPGGFPRWTAWEEELLIDLIQQGVPGDQLADELRARGVRRRPSGVRARARMLGIQRLRFVQNSDPLVLAETIEQRLGVSGGRVLVWLRSGDLPATRSRQRWYVRESSLLKLIADPGFWPWLSPALIVEPLWRETLVDAQRAVGHTWLSMAEVGRRVGLGARAVANIAHLGLAPAQRADRAWVVWSDDLPVWRQVVEQRARRVGGGPVPELVLGNCSTAPPVRGVRNKGERSSHVHVNVASACGS